MESKVEALEVEFQTQSLVTPSIDGECKKDLIVKEVEVAESKVNNAGMNEPEVEITSDVNITDEKQDQCKKEVDEVESTKQDSEQLTVQKLAEVVHQLVMNHARQLAEHEERIKALEAERNELKQQLSLKQTTLHPQQTTMSAAETVMPGKGEGKVHPAVNNPFSFVEELEPLDFVVSAERHKIGSKLHRPVPVAPAIDLQVQVPEDFEPGQKVFTQSPHGTIEVEPPAGIKGGETFQCQLAPPAALKVTVPPGFTGSSLMFRLTDGSHISVPVPSETRPGEVITVGQPAVLVWVPQGAQTGEIVSFSIRGGNGDNNKVEWFCAQIPAKLCSGYFVARLPRPTRSNSFVEDLEQWMVSHVHFLAQ